MKCSTRVQSYFDSLNTIVKKEYSIAELARAKKLDPEEYVGIPLAQNLAERVEGLISVESQEIVGKGIPNRILELEKQWGAGDWRVGLVIAEEVSFEKFCKFESKLRAIEIGVRVGLAYLTMGVVSAPLEGFLELKEKKRLDGGTYLAIYYGGPIRAAGGTAAAVSVLLADYLRKKHNYLEYDPTEKELERYFVEITDYHERVARLQYYPAKEEVLFLAKNVPLQIDGDPTAERDVSNFKDLERIETNRIRGGMCLVIAEGLAQKAKKITKNIDKWGASFGLSHWTFLNQYLELHKKVLDQSEKKDADTSKVKPNYRYIQETVAGRPVFGYPMQKGGFRLRYGRTRLSGLAGAAINPVSMQILDNFIATGTQLKVERPGKACVVTPCDSICGPFVRLKNGVCTRIDNFDSQIKYSEVEKIISNGDILFNYGDFTEQGHILIPSPYVEEWWIQDFKKIPKEEAVKIIPAEKYNKIILNYFFEKPSAEESFNISRTFGIPLHPEYSLCWNNIKKEDVLFLSEYLSKYLKFSTKINFDKKIKEILETLEVPHKLEENSIILEPEFSFVVFSSLGAEIQPEIIEKEMSVRSTPLELVNAVSNIIIKDRAPFYVGCRMGRPEKAKLRTLTGKPHVLFPCGAQGGKIRAFGKALEEGFVEADFPLHFCENCKTETVFQICENCKTETKKMNKCRVCGKTVDAQEHCGEKTSRYKKTRIDIAHYLNTSLKEIHSPMPILLKGVRGMSSKDKIPEHLEKGVLRALHDVYVNKDGTIRLDAIETPITHFKPKEIGTSISKLRELGYYEDIDGKPLENEEQILELLPQDVVLPGCTEWKESDFSKHLKRMCDFVDELLVKLYKAEPYYNIKTKEDLAGLLGIALAPHTSAGTVCRVIGFSKTQGYYAHPLMHAACRRNCDGDELGFMLLLDALLNFSRKFLPDKRGSRTMDSPLVLTTVLDPKEVDTEVHNMDTVWNYPLEFYYATEQYKNPGDFSMERMADRLGKDSQFEGVGYTHPVFDMNSGPLVSSYKTLLTMKDKLDKQIDLADKLTALKSADVAEMVIEKHFLKDIKGNLRRFSSQEVRCTNCNKKYRRFPLAGRCVCGHKLIFTVSPGSILKYLEPSIGLAERYKLSDYMQQTLYLLKQRIEYVLGKDKEKQTGLSSFF